jgi:phage/plasmid primase-like uncharacterized protein
VESSDGGKEAAKAEQAMGEVDVRVQRILEDAERRAGHLAGIADSLIDQAEGAKQEAEQLLEAVRDAARRLTAEDETGESINTAAASGGARVLVTQLVAGGSSRAEIEDRLRDDFGIDDPRQTVEAILGPDS